MRTAISQRQDVMCFRGRRQTVLYLTLLAKGARLDILRADFLPRAAVTFVGVRITQVSVVLMFRNLLVFVAELSVGQSSAAGMSSFLQRGGTLPGALTSTNSIASRASSAATRASSASL